MYLFKDALISITRNKGRNILIGIIIVVIACASSITLAIRNTANNIVRDYQNTNDIVGTISFNRNTLMEKFQGGENAIKSNIEAFNNVEQIKIDQIKSYGESDNLKGYYYIYSTSLNSDTLTKATETYEYEVEDKQTSTTTKRQNFGERPPMMAGPDGKTPNFGTNIERNTTITITKSMERFNSSRMLTGDFLIDGYSSYDAMEDFTSGLYKVTDGVMISKFDEFECVINEELAKLNEIKVGDTIKLNNINNKDKACDFKVVGIYKDNSEQENTQSMYSRSVNTIIVGSGTVSKMVADDAEMATNITPSFILKNKESIDKFSEELKSKGLNEHYALTTNLEDIEGATKSIENVSTFATTFLIIILIISAIVLLVVNMINIRERKYEIGVFRTIGLSKVKLTLQFIIELIIVSVIGLAIGAGIGAALSKDVGNYLLESEINKMQSDNENIRGNFGLPNMPMEFNRGVQIKQIDNIDAVVDYVVLLQLLGIGLFLTLIGSIASMISINRFSPLTILQERS